MAPFRRRLDPYLSGVQERFVEARDYLEGRKPFLGITISFLFAAVLLASQRMVVDRKGVSIIEQLTRL